MAKPRPVFTARSLEAQLRAFYRTELGDLHDAAGVAIKAVANKHRSKVLRQIKQNFRQTQDPRSKSFFRAVKAYHLKPEGKLGYASFVRAGVPFMHIFETGGTITRKKAPNLVIRLAGAERMGLARVNDKKNFGELLRRAKALLRLVDPQAKIIRVPYGETIYFYGLVSGELRPLYKYQPSVRLQKRIKFFEEAETLHKEIPKLIQNLVE